MSSDKSIFLIVAGCGDYYCENSHPIAAFESKTAAEAAIAESPDLKLKNDEGWMMDEGECTIWEIPLNRLKIIFVPE